MKIAIGCDHGALNLKNKMVSYLEAKGFEVKDFGTYTNASCDYPEFAAAAARAVASGECEKGIVLCTTGIGMSIAANKVSGARCALLSDLTGYNIQVLRYIIPVSVKDLLYLIIKIIKRFTHTHHNNIRNPDAVIFCGCHYLSQHFRCGKISFKSAKT